MFKVNIISYMAQTVSAARWMEKQIQILKNGGHKEVAPGIWEHPVTKAVTEF